MHLQDVDYYRVGIALLFHLIVQRSFRYKACGSMDFMILISLP